jgi:hypothetical protein
MIAMMTNQVYLYLHKTIFRNKLLGRRDPLHVQIAINHQTTLIHRALKMAGNRDKSTSVILNWRKNCKKGDSKTKRSLDRQYQLISTVQEPQCKVKDKQGQQQEHDVNLIDHVACIIRFVYL